MIATVIGSALLIHGLAGGEIAGVASQAVLVMGGLAIIGRITVRRR